MGGQINMYVHETINNNDWGWRGKEMAMVERRVFKVYFLVYSGKKNFEYLYEGSGGGLVASEKSRRKEWGVF